jgi:hypothetical protein
MYCKRFVTGHFLGGSTLASHGLLTMMVRSYPPRFDLFNERVRPEWPSLFVRVKPALDEARALRLDKSRRDDRRRLAATHVYSNALRAGAVSPEHVARVPHPRDCWRLYPIANFVANDRFDPSINKAELETAVHAAISYASDRIRGRVAGFASAVPALQDPATEQPLDDMQKLCLASTVFFSPTGHPEYGVTMLRTSRFDFFANQVEAAFDQEAHTVVLELLQLLGLPATTTGQDLVDLDACFSCRQCRLGAGTSALPLDRDVVERGAVGVLSWADAVRVHAA